MNAVVNLDNFRKSDHTSLLFFPVQLVEAGVKLNEQFVLDPNRQAIVRTDTNQILGVHTKDYRFVSNKEIYTAFDQALHYSQLDLTGMITNDRLSHDGARAFRRYTFPAHEYEISTGDTVQLKLDVVNSYDGALAFDAVVGAWRFLCSNGLIIGEKWAQTHSRHTSGFNAELAVKKISSALDTYCQNAKEWQTWTGQKITDEQAQAAINKMPGINPKLHQQLWQYWEREKKQLGSTKWALFNALTFWSSHADIRKSFKRNAASIVFQRESKVRSVINSKAFKLAA